MITLKTNIMKYKDSDGKMQSLSVAAEKKITDISLTQNGIPADAKATGDELSRLQEEKVDQITPLMFGAVGDGTTDDTNAFVSLINELNSGETVNLLGKTYVINNSLSLSNIYLTNGTINYKGLANKQIFTLSRNSGLIDININIHTANYASDVVYVDYTTEGNTWVTGKYIIDGLHITNSAETTAFVENSACVRIRYYSYQVIWGQTINNLTFDGLMDYGIYIEPWLKRADYNPVYNTSVFSNVLFKTVNCALKTLPIVGDSIESAVPATDTETAGGVGLYLERFTNQSIVGLTKPFMDLHNTKIEGDMVIPWDYYGERMPQDGIFKTYNSKVYLNMEYAHDSSERRTNSRVGWTEYSTGEKFTNCNSFYLDNVGEGSPYRDEETKMPWSIDNARLIRFSADGKTLLGMQYSFNNETASNGQNSVQFGFYEGCPFIRTWDATNAKWGELLPVMVTKTSQLTNDSCFIAQKNLVLNSVDSNGEIYEGYGYKRSSRINSSGSVSATSNTAMVTGFISVSDDVALNISECQPFASGGVNSVIAVYDENFTFLGSFTGNNNKYGVFENTLSEYGKATLQEIDGTWIWRVPSGANIAYVRISADCETNGFMHVAFDSPFVESVNGKIGQVRLTAEDVNALPVDTKIPAKISELTNDAGFLTQHQSLEGYAKESKAESWKFTLADGSTVTKKVVLA